MTKQETALLPMEAADEPSGVGEWYVNTVNEGPIETTIIVRTDSTYNAKRVAHAIAAAPDLLEACKAMTQVVEQLIPEPSARGVADVVLFSARAAIAKAEGK